MVCIYSKCVRDKSHRICGFTCSVTGTECHFSFPDSKMCAKMYNMGPDSYSKKDEVVNKVVDEIVSYDD